MDHLRAEMALAYLAEGAHSLPWRQRFTLAGIEVKEAKHQLCIAVFDEADELASPAILDFGVDDGALDLPRAAGLEGG